MSITVPPSDGDAPAGSAAQSPTALADEGALHAAFLAEYRGLAAEARTDLGAAGNLSQKVVEGAFVRAWDARAKIKTTDELHRFLVDDVHRATARALGRRAAAQHTRDPGAPPEGVADVLPNEGGAAASGEIDPDAAWSHIQHALHGEAHSPEALARAAEVSRHDAAHHIAAATKERDWKLLVAVGALAALGLAALLVWFDRAGDDQRLARALEATDTRVVATPAGRVGEVRLADGSRVRLAPDSKLSIPATFGDRVRGVDLEGAASFEVAPGQSRPFRVRARDVTVVATGTSFVVRDYAGDPAVTVAVTAGSVAIHNPDESATLPAGDAVYVARGTTPRPVSRTEREATVGWANGVLAIDDQPLVDVLPQLHRWYGMDVGVPDSAMLTRRVTVRASLDSAAQVIRGIERSTGLEFGYAGRNMVLRAPAAAKPAPRR